MGFTHDPQEFSGCPFVARLPADLRAAVADDDADQVHRLQKKVHRLEKKRKAARKELKVARAAYAPCLQ